MDIQLRFPLNCSAKFDCCATPIMCNRLHHKITDRYACYEKNWNFAEFLRGPWIYSGRYDVKNLEISVIECNDLLRGPRTFCTDFKMTCYPNFRRSEHYTSNKPDYQIRKLKSTGMQEFTTDAALFNNMETYEGMYRIPRECPPPLYNLIETIIRDLTPVFRMSD